MKLSDQEVLQGIQEGGPRIHKILDYVYLRSRSKIIRYVKKHGGNKEDGQDILQEAVTTFYTNVLNDKFRGESDIEGYIYGIARNIWLKSLRKTSKMKIVSDENLPLTSVKEEDKSATYRNDLKKVLAQMDDLCRSVLIYSFYFNYSAEELKTQFDFKNEQVARNKKYKCLKKMRNIINKSKIFRR